MTGRRAPPYDLLDAVLAAVTARTGISAADMVDRRRRHARDLARHVYYWTAYRGAGGTLPFAAIGGHLGRSWHAARHGVGVVDERRKDDPDLRRLTDDLRASFAAAPGPNPQ